MKEEDAVVLQQVVDFMEKHELTDMTLGEFRDLMAEVQDHHA